MSKLEVINQPIVVLEQRGVLNYSNLDNVIKSKKQEIKDLELDKIVANEENKQLLKTTRTSIRNQHKELKRDVKLIKGEFMQPFNKFSEQVKELDDFLKKTDIELRDKVADVEDKQKAEKQKELEKYYEEYKQHTINNFKGDKVNFDFITFADMELNITLSATPKKLKEQVETKLDNFANDLYVIETNEHYARLFNSYKRTKHLATSLAQVQEAVKAEQELKERLPEKEEKKVEEVKSVGVAKVMNATFRIDDTLDNIKKVVQFMKDNDITYKGV